MPEKTAFFSTIKTNQICPPSKAKQGIQWNFSQVMSRYCKAIWVNARFFTLQLLAQWRIFEFSRAFFLTYIINQRWELRSNELLILHSTKPFLNICPQSTVTHTVDPIHDNIRRKNWLMSCRTWKKGDWKSHWVNFF